MIKSVMAEKMPAGLHQADTQVRPYRLTAPAMAWSQVRRTSSML